MSSDRRFKGRVTSFLSTELQRYTSFKAHVAADGPVRQILVNEKGVIALGSKNIHMALRRGIPIWHLRCVCHSHCLLQAMQANGMILDHRHDSIKDLRCMSFTSKGTTELLAAGLQDTMLVIDLNKGEVMKQVCFHLAMP